MIVGPLALVRGKRKAGKVDQFLALGVILLALGATVAGCVMPPSTPIPTQKATSDPTATPVSTATAYRTGSPTPSQTPTETAYISLASATSTPTIKVTIQPCCPEPTPNPNPESGDILDRQQLSKAPRGEKFYDLYLAMVDQTQKIKWWNQDYGGEDGFSIWEFMSIMWTYDARLDLPVVKEAMHNRAKAFCPYGCDPTTREGSLIYMSVFVQSVRDRVDKWHKGMDPDAPGVIDNSFSDISPGTSIVEAIRTSNVDINTLDAMDPLNYGNISLSFIYKEMVDKGFILKQVPASNGDHFFVLSKCQDYFAQSAMKKWPSPETLNQEEFNQSYIQYCGIEIRG